MSVESDLVTFLTGTTAISDLVGSRVYGSVGPNSASEDSYIVFALISGVPGQMHMSGSAVPTDRTYDITAWACTYEAAVAICDAIAVALQAYDGTFGDDDCKFSQITSMKDGISSDDPDRVWYARELQVDISVE